MGGGGDPGYTTQQIYLFNPSPIKILKGKIQSPWPIVSRANE